MKPLLLVPLALAAAVTVGVVASHGSGGGGPQTPPWLVLASTRDGGAYSYGGGNAYVMRPDGSRLTRLLGAESALSPADVSADGRVIAYRTADGSAIYVSRSDGSHLTRVLGPRHRELFSDVSLSPDGATLALTYSDRNDHPRLLVVSADGRHRHNLRRASSPDWSADGRMLVFSTLRGCGLAAEPFTAVQARIRGLCGAPTFSPDARSVVFQTKGGCIVAATPSRSSLLLLERVTADDRVLVRGTCIGPDWSPDGRWVAFESPSCIYCDSERDRRAAERHRGVWVVRPHGSGRLRVGPVDDESDARYSWSPDGERLAIVAGPRIFVADLHGHAVRIRGIAAASSAAPTWSRDGRRLTRAARTGEDPAQIWSVPPDGTGLRRLTSAGVNDVVGVARLAEPVRPPARPIRRSEWVLGPHDRHRAAGRAARRRRRPDRLRGRQRR